MASKTLEIYSWNLNGIRAAAKKGLVDWFQLRKPDFVGLQEVRAAHKDIPPELLELPGYKTDFVAAERKGYSGVGIYSALPVEFRECLLGDQEMDAEGRLQEAQLGELRIINGYFPNGSGKNRDNSRIPFKLDFYARLRQRIQTAADQGERILVMGDWNTAHMPIDLARPKQNVKTSGFCPEERESFDQWIQSNWVDTFRHFHRGEGNYTWWSQRFGVREKNIGWRIDYILASPAAMEFVRGAAIHPHDLGSDHCPISVSLDPGVLTKG
ncbi:MAG: exodeoxyribonuclease III [Polyangiaceae bacterium]|nr:exodeoxyribonuclease III [Polyangiaceae bacterium]